jgi:hypothetical protein
MGRISTVRGGSAIQQGGEQRNSRFSAARRGSARRYPAFDMVRVFSVEKPADGIAWMRTSFALSRAVVERQPKPRDHTVSLQMAAR